VNPLECIARAQDVHACDPSAAETLALTASVRSVEDEVLAELGGVPQLATWEDICDAERCRIAGDGFLRYADDGHLSIAYTQTQHDELADLLQAAVD
jgi:hypothetical protein